jgi:hypothetical protein
MFTQHNRSVKEKESENTREDSGTVSENVTAVHSIGIEFDEDYQ